MAKGSKKKVDGFVRLIKHKLFTDQKWLERGIVAIFEKQTHDEQRVENSIVYNKVGFSGYDAKSMSYYAKWIMSGHHLNGKHLEKAKLKMLKYANQLAKIAIEKRKLKGGGEVYDPKENIRTEV